MRSTEPAADVFLGLFLNGVGKDFLGLAKLNEAAQIKERSMIGAPSSLLHVMGHDHDGELFFQLKNPSPHPITQRLANFSQQSHPTHSDYCDPES